MQIFKESTVSKVSDAYGAPKMLTMLMSPHYPGFFLFHILPETMIKMSRREQVG